MSVDANFIAGYTEQDRSRIDFAWNGKHAAEFVDTNQEKRWAVISRCINEPELASPVLLEHLFLADAAWAREAWGSNPSFAALASVLLQRGGEAALDTFARGFTTSFDTFGACHEMKLGPELSARLAVVARDRAAETTDDDLRKCLESSAELFSKLQRGIAQEGWATVPPGTPVHSVRVVSPRWYHYIGRKISAWIRRAT